MGAESPEPSIGDLTLPCSWLNNSGQGALATKAESSLQLAQPTGKRAHHPKPSELQTLAKTLYDACVECLAHVECFQHTHPWECDKHRALVCRGRSTRGHCASMTHYPIEGDVPLTFLLVVALCIFKPSGPWFSIRRCVYRHVNFTWKADISIAFWFSSCSE